MKGKRKNNLRKFWTGDLTRKCATTILSSYELGRSVLSMSDEEISSFEIDPRTYLDTSTFRDDWLCASLLAKYPGLNLGRDLVAEALYKFAASELTCCETNVRLLSSSPKWGVDAVIMTARRKIARLLGTFSYESLNSRCGFSNGASTRLRRVEGSAPMKFSIGKEKLHVTRDALPYALAAVRSSPSWRSLLQMQGASSDLLDAFRIVVGNSITTVPKNAKTDRTIAKEPCMNMYLQRGVGSMIRSALKRVGVDLDSQRKNQQLALLGSRDGDLVTLDLSAASDSISIELCRLLLPEDWFQVILDLRSHYGRLPDGTLIRYQKISSMGNGYTFELESLLFWSLLAAQMDISACSDRRFAVYGDDLICSNQYADDLVEVLKHCGFELNREKSFVNGHFRESCGKHYFRGHDVTPFYIRKPIDSVFRLYWLCNSYRRWVTRPCGFALQDSYIVWRSLRNRIPKRWQKVIIPEGFGDGGLLVTLAEGRPKLKSYAYKGLAIRPVVTQYTPGDSLMYLNRLRQGYSKSNTRSIVTNERYDPFESIMLDKGIPDAYQLNRYVSAVWADPGWFIRD